MAGDSGDGGVLERPGALISIAGALAVGVIAGGAWWWLHRHSVRPRAALIPGDHTPAITVEVLNETSVDGLAREIAGRLRAQGIDVVYVGSSARRDRDSTVIVVRRGGSTGADPVRRALGTGRILRELDPKRLLDASVLVGRDLTAPLERHP